MYRYEVDDVEFDRASLIAVTHREVEPLRVPTRIYIVLHYQVVLVLSHLDMIGCTL
jgi:hypothetical protein